MSTEIPDPDEWVFSNFVSRQTINMEKVRN